MTFESKLVDFHSKNALQNVGCEMTAILSRPQCVKPGSKWSPMSNDDLVHCSTNSSATMVLTIHNATDVVLKQFQNKLNNRPCPYCPSY